MHNDKEVMQPFVSHTGRVAALARANVDTDQIIPKQFLKRIERTGFGAFLFYDWRYQIDGTPNPEFELNRAESRGATVLLAGQNFGCGSSREHAPWALADFGFRTIIAPSFADIFYSNCMQNGLLPVVLPEAAVTRLFRRCATSSGYEVTVDLEAREVRDAAGFRAGFKIEEYQREMLLLGLDEIGRTLLDEPLIADYERKRSILSGKA
ncbi:MAG: 3-isopropylmalate/(R)-2-methylmalate dehydratase small subunit [Gemmatimonadales bacterium]|jgi:3-isopropylmalate/(R)-2-methylmalate dehydratase small subunit|nr:3-isopropylmalate/(R)-2-methylmalate dehydratase small subunit [Gemmatimonadales bacterium]